MLGYLFIEENDSVVHISELQKCVNLLCEPKYKILHNSSMKNSFKSGMEVGFLKWTAHKNISMSGLIFI